MDPITAFSTAITSIKTATEIAQLLRSSDDTFLKAELRLRLADMMNALADAKISISELKELTQEKDELIKSLEADLRKARSNSSELKFEKGAYYTLEGDGPFCTACYDTKSKKVRLTEMPVGFQDFGTQKCPGCGSVFP